MFIIYMYWVCDFHLMNMQIEILTPFYACNCYLTYQAYVGDRDKYKLCLKMLIKYKILVANAGGWCPRVFLGSIQGVQKLTELTFRWP